MFYFAAFDFNYDLPSSMRNFVKSFTTRVTVNYDGPDDKPQLAIRFGKLHSSEIEQPSERGKYRRKATLQDVRCEKPVTTRTATLPLCGKICIANFFAFF